MLLLSDRVAVPLDVLNNDYQPMARFDAHLVHLHGDWATLTLPAHAPVSCVHWGSLVRFWISDGGQRYEAQGVVVAHAALAEADVLLPPRLQIGHQKSQQTESPLEEDSTREIVVHLWQCLQQTERRGSPRRRIRFAVLLRPANEGVAGPLSPAPDARTPADAEACWEQGWAVDISAGGLCLRTRAILPARQRLALQFALPRASCADDQTSTRRFLLYGRILRSERTRSASAFESMISFEHLSPADGLALSHFLVDYD